MKFFTEHLARKISYYSLFLLVLSCSTDEQELENNTLSSIAESSQTIAHSDLTIAQRFAPVFFQDVDTTDGLCSNQSKTGSSDWITAVDYDGDWNTKNNWDNMVSGRDSGKLIPYVYYYVTYTETHFFILYSVYHPRDWTDIPFLCSLDSHENDMEAVLITARRTTDGDFGRVINAQTIFHTDVYGYAGRNLIYKNGTKQSIFFIEAKGHGIRAYEGDSDKDGSHIGYYYDSAPAVSPNKLPENVHYNLLPLETTLWLQRDNPLTVTGTALVGDNGDGSNKASTPWGWENGVLCKNPAQYLKDKYGWSNFLTEYISDTPIQ